MARGRRSVGLHDPSGWVFNRMADVYDARPAYPGALVDALAARVGTGGRVVDVGAGVGHLALPLAARGFEVTAAEPATAMLERLRAAAEARGLSLDAVHAAAEALPLPDASADLVVVADALHFLDAERAALEIARVLAPGGGTLAIVTAALGDTPFMRGVARLMEEAAPRRPRDVTDSMRQLAALAGVTLEETLRFEDATPVGPEILERILRSISFIGPAMNPERFAAFRERIHGLPGPAVWARELTLRCYRRER